MRRSKDDEGVGAPLQRAEELQMDACLSEMAGRAPAADLAKRILAAAAARPAAGREQSTPRWLVAALLLLGVGVVVAVAVMQHDKRGGEAPAVAPQEPDKPQDKTAPPSPHAEAIREAIHSIELTERRAEATKVLKHYGAEALPLLEQALAQDQNRRRPEILDALRAAYGTVSAGLLAFAEPVTLVADYSDNRVRFANAKGEVLWNRDDVFGAWDAEVTPQKTLLLTEFSISRVEELDRDGNVLWFFDSLKNPYDADRLPNGNTLIADTFGNRVIEVRPDKKIVWTYDQEIRPFDADRLANGNTLIADVMKDRVLEVSPAGEIVWDVKNLNNVHDADRLPNGNTLITLRSAGKVIEVDPTGKTVWQLDKLDAPGDADRLPNGNTLVAENKQVREFDKDGALVWKYATTWAVEVNRY